MMATRKAVLLLLVALFLTGLVSGCSGGQVRTVKAYYAARNDGDHGKAESYLDRSSGTMGASVPFCDEGLEKDLQKLEILDEKKTGDTHVVILRLTQRHRTGYDSCDNWLGRRVYLEKYKSGWKITRMDSTK